MPSKNDHPISIYIDPNPNPLFSERVIDVLSSSGIRTQKLYLPKKKSEIFKWSLALIKSKTKIIHYFWGSYHPFIYIIPKLLGKKVIIHWIGSDVLDAISNHKRKGTYWLLQKIAYKIVDSHLADFQPLADELESLGIKASLIPLIPDLPLFQENISWPVENNVFVYLPETRHEFYGSDIIFQLAEEMTDINFFITRHSGKNAPFLPNIKYYPWVDDLEAIWEQTKVYIRLTKHDGLSHTVIEALARGKHVIWSYEFPYCYQAKTFKEAKYALREIFTQNQPNIGGVNYVQSEFQPFKISKLLKTIYGSSLF